MVDQTDAEGRTPLWAACFDGHLVVAALLVGAGAAVDAAKPSSGATPLYLAAQEGHVEVARPGRGAGERKWRKHQLKSKYNPLHRREIESIT